MTDVLVFKTDVIKFLHPRSPVMEKIFSLDSSFLPFRL